MLLLCIINIIIIYNLCFRYQCYWAVGRVINRGRRGVNTVVIIAICGGMTGRDVRQCGRTRSWAVCGPHDFLELRAPKNCQRRKRGLPEDPRTGSAPQGARTTRNLGRPADRWHDRFSHTGRHLRPRHDCAVFDFPVPTPHPSYYDADTVHTETRTHTGNVTSIVRLCSSAFVSAFKLLLLFFWPSSCSYRFCARPTYDCYCKSPVCGRSSLEVTEPPPVPYPIIRQRSAAPVREFSLAPPLPVEFPLRTERKIRKPPSTMSDPAKG